MYDAYCPTCGDRIAQDQGYMATIADVFLKCPELAIVGFLKGNLVIDEKKVAMDVNNLEYTVLRDYYEAKKMVFTAGSRPAQGPASGAPSFPGSPAAANDKQGGRPSQGAPAFNTIGGPAAVGGRPAPIGGAGGGPAPVGGAGGGSTVVGGAGGGFGGRGKQPSLPKDVRDIIQNTPIKPAGDQDLKKPNPVSPAANQNPRMGAGNVKPSVNNLSDADRKKFESKIKAFKDLILGVKDAKTQPDLWHLMQELTRKKRNDPSYELKTGDDDLFEEVYEKYVWAKIFLTKIIVWGDGSGKFDPITSRILSFRTREEIHRIDIRKKFLDFNAGYESSAYWRLRRTMDNLLPVETLASYHDHYERIIKFLQPVVECTADFSTYIKLAAYEGENSGLVNSAYYQTSENRIKVFRRICPHCGADISLYSNIYPQEIISFIGTSTCGKSTTIVALYKELKSGAIPGVKVILNEDDPFAQQYKESLALMERHLAIKKTNKDENPSLSALVARADGSDQNIRLMTFVDIPGELLQGDNRCFGRFRIMANSKMVCIVIAAEQLVKKKGNPMKVASEVTAKNNPIELVGAIEGFRDDIFEDRAIPPVSLVISKADALEPEVVSPSRDDWYRYDASGFVTVEHPGHVLHRKGAEEAVKNYWVDSVSADLAKDSCISDGVVMADDLAKLYISLQNESMCYRSQAGMNYVDLKTMFSLQEKKHKVLGDFRKTLIRDILEPLTHNESWDDVPVFLLAAMGFYAVEDAWKTTEIEKHRALNAAFGGIPNLPPDLFEQLKKHTKTLDDCRNFFSTPSSEMKILANLGINAESVDRALKERYTTGHASKGSLGVKYFLYWMLTYTGVMDFLYNDYESDKTNRTFIEFNRTYIEYYDINTGTTRRCDRHAFFAKYKPFLTPAERQMHPELTDLTDTEKFKSDFIDMRKRFAHYAQNYERLIDQMGWLKKHFYFINKDYIEIAECRDKVTDSMMKKSESMMLQRARDKRRPLRIF